jgi:hypothetical protein
MSLMTGRSVFKIYSVAAATLSPHNRFQRVKGWTRRAGRRLGPKINRGIFAARKKQRRANRRCHKRLWSRHTSNPPIHTRFTDFAATRSHRARCERHHQHAANEAEYTPYLQSPELLPSLYRGASVVVHLHEGGHQAGSMPGPSVNGHHNFVLNALQR